MEETKILVAQCMVYQYLELPQCTGMALFLPTPI